MEPIAFYTWYDLTLAVQHEGPQTAAELGPLLHDLSWARIEANNRLIGIEVPRVP